MVSNVNIGGGLQMLRRVFKKDQPGAKKTILFSPLDSHGHINSLVAIARHLKSLGHRTVFLLIEPIENNLKAQGHEVYDSLTPDLVESKPSDSAQDKWNAVIKECQEVWSSGDIMRNFRTEFELGFGAMIDDIKKYNSNVEKKLDAIKPDIIIVDHYFAIPALFAKNLPWIRIFSASPLALHNSVDLPTAWLGLPSKWDQNDATQKQYQEEAMKIKTNLRNSYNEYWTSFGLADLPTNPPSCMPTSPHLNIYMYPEELDYSEHPLPDWKRCDSMVRDQKAKGFKIPEKLRNKPGKLIFLSLGSLASADIVLMKRIVSMLADSPHRFIVCKGPLHDKYELADNMWGDKFVPQLEVLKVVDLIITHGGNNTLTESFYYGVPGFIVCPLFGDQFDNATRMQEKGLGIRLDPYNCTKDELLNAIESMLANDDTKKRMKVVSARMRKPEARNRAIKLVADFVAQQAKSSAAACQDQQQSPASS